MTALNNPCDFMGSIKNVLNCINLTQKARTTVNLKIINMILLKDTILFLSSSDIITC